MHLPPAARLRTRPAGSPAWPVLLVLLVALPSITGTEEVAFAAGAFELNLRFVVYAAAAAVVALLALPVVLRLVRTEARFLALPALVLAWMLLSTAASGLPPREWLPPLTRWVLSLGVFVLAWDTGRSAMGEQARHQAQLAVMLGAIAPLVVGGWELVSGTAPILNNAPRISGTTLGHPVEFSLICMVAGLVALPLALRVPGTGRRLALAAAALVAVALVEILFTYTRLTLVIALAGAVAVVVAVSPRRRLRAGGMASAVAVLVLVVGAPLLISRFEQPVGVRPQPSAAPGQSPLPSIDLGPTPTPRLVVIDNSTKLRIETHRRGVGYIASAPLLGHGMGSFDWLFYRDTGNDNVAAHDDLLLYAVELGLPGLLLILLLYARVLVPLLPALADGLAGRGFAVSALAAFGLVNVAAVIHNPTYFPELQVTVWVLVGLALATAPGLAEVGAWVRRGPPGRSRPARPAPPA